MSEFKFVQWGKGTPVDYQRLNAMMVNEQYLKDVVDNAPRGVLAWKQSTSDTTSTAGTYVSFNGIGSVVFEVEEDRMIKFSLFIYGITNAAAPSAGVAAFDFEIDGTRVDTSGATTLRIYTDSGLSSGNPVNAPFATFFTTSALSAGTHTVTPKLFSAFNAVTAKASVRLLIEDIGKFIPASS